MFTCDFSKRGEKSLYEFLIETVKAKITNGSLKANEKLPSKRALASHLGISVITVQNAYAELISEGYIYSIEKKGFFVTELPFDSPAEKSRSKEKSRAKKSAEKNSSAEIFADLASNSIAQEKFPFSVWSHLTRKILNSPHENILKSQPFEGALVLREAIAAHLKSFRNMDVSAEQIFVGAGTEVLYSFIVRFLGEEKIFAVENPGYKKIAGVLEMNGAKIARTAIDENGMEIFALKKNGASVVHVTPNNHFPTGVVMTVKRRMEFLAWLKEDENRFIIEDDYDSEFRFSGKPIAPLQSSAEGQNVIYVNTFSKTLSPSFRIGFLVLPQKLVSPFKEKFRFCSCTVGALEQYVLASFLSEGFYAKHIARMKNYYRNIRNELAQQIERQNENSLLKISEENSGLHFLLTIKSNLAEKKIKSNLEKNGIKISLLSDFFSADDEKNSFADEKKIPPEKTFVVNYSGVEKQKIPQIVSRILQSVQQDF
jgi:GntR family transcriptional regulator/MocR family aminotransferase